MIEKIRDLPTLPQVALELMTLAFSDEPDIQAVASVIEKDPTLTAKLLKTVNSASFGLRVEVKTTHQAVSLLGLESLRATIIAITLGEYFVKGGLGRAVDVRKFCAHSLATAVIMREVASILRLAEADLLYLLGLLHDMDKLVLDFIFEEGYASVLEQVRKGTSFAEAERQCFRLEGRTVWLDAAKAWGLPQRVIELYEGSAKGKDPVPVRDLIRTASDMADRLGYAFLPIEKGNEEERNTLLARLPEGAELRLGKAVKDQVAALRTVLELPPPDEEEVQRTFLRTTRKLSVVNAELEIKIDLLDRLTRASMGVIKSLENDTVTLPVLKGLATVFPTQAAFLLKGTESRGMNGVMLLSAATGASEEVRKVTLPPTELPQPFRHAMNDGKPRRMDGAEARAFLAPFLPNGDITWVVPVMVKGRFHALLGLVAAWEGLLLFSSRDMEDALRILSGELGLAFEVARLYRHIRIESITDPLTRINNRGAILRILHGEFARFRRSGVPLSVAIFDMDHFKALNDNLGHLAGDEFLVEAARTLKTSVRESDYVGRYGGDEFVAVFPGTHAEAASTVVERVRAVLLQVCARHSAPAKGLRLSVSAGVAETDPDMPDANALLHRADEALYEAKEGGRNRCIVAGCVTAPVA